MYRDNDARTSNKANSNGNNDNNDDNDNNDHNDHNDNKDNDDSNDHNDINDNNDNNDFTDRNDDNDENGNNGNKGSEKKCTSSTSSSSSTPPSVASGLSNFTLYGVETLHQVKLRKVSITLSSSSSFSSLASFSSASLSINGSLDHDIKARDAAIAKKSSSNDDRNEVDENDDKAITDHNRHKNKTNNCKLNDTDTGVAGGRGSNATTTATMEELLTILALGQDGKVYVCQLYDDDHYARNICSLSSSSSSSTVARAGSTPSISSLPCPFPPSSVSPLMTRTATTITTSLYSTPPLSSAPVVANGNYTNAKSAADKVSIGTPVNNDARIERDTYKANVCGIVHDKWKRRGKLKLPTHIEPGRGAASDRTRRRRVDTDCHNETHFDSASGTNNCMSETDDNNTNTQISDYDSEDEGDDVEDAIDSLDVYRPQFTPRSLLECWYALEVHYTTLSSIMSPVYVEYMINRYLPILKFDSAEVCTYVRVLWRLNVDGCVHSSSLFMPSIAAHTTLIFISLYPLET